MLFYTALKKSKLTPCQTPTPITAGISRSHRNKILALSAVIRDRYFPRNNVLAYSMASLYFHLWQFPSAIILRGKNQSDLLTQCVHLNIPIRLINIKI